MPPMSNSSAGSGALSQHLNSSNTSPEVSSGRVLDFSPAGSAGRRLLSSEATGPSSPSTAAQRWFSLPGLRTSDNGSQKDDAAGKGIKLAVKGALMEESKLPERTISLLKLTAMTCAAVAGGPYGFEDCIGAGGAYLTLVFLLIIPFFWSLPMALMTAELSCMMPENGGHVLWIDKAFGPFWSFQNSYWTLLQAVFEGGLYPVMFMDYLARLFDVVIGTRERLIIGLVMVAAMAVINIYGADIVGSASMLFALVAMSPFVGMMVLGLPKVNFVASIWSQEAVSVNWPLFVTILLWNTSGYDLMGACAGEVKNPATNFPKALTYSMVFTVAVNITILAVGVSLLPDHTKWMDGTFVQVAENLGGKPLALLFTLGAAVNVVGLLCTLLCVASRIVYGMATVGTLPRIFAATHRKYRTPHVAMGSIAALMALTTVLPFSALAQAEMWFYSLTTILKFGALVQLRGHNPEAARPYRIPLGYWGVVLFVTGPVLCCIALVALSDRQTHIVGLAGTVLSLAAYLIGTRGGTVKPDHLIEFQALGSL